MKEAVHISTNQVVNVEFARLDTGDGVIYTDDTREFRWTELSFDPFYIVECKEAKACSQ